MKGISVKLPLKYTTEDGPYYLNKDLSSVVKQNLRMLMLTNPGERIMDPGFGVGIKRLLFHMRAGDRSEIDIRQTINDQIKRYLSFVIVEDVKIFTDLNDENYISVSLEYSVPSLREKNKLNLVLS